MKLLLILQFKLSFHNRSMRSLCAVPILHEAAGQIKGSIFSLLHFALTFQEYIGELHRMLYKPFVGHGKLRWIGNKLALWTNKVLHFQKKVMMNLILQIIIARNQLNVLLSFLCFLRAHISRKVVHHKYTGTMIDKRKCL